MKKINKTPLALAMGASLLPSLAINIAHAETNPFALSELSSGYMQTAEAKTDAAGADKMKDGACGEGKCGAAMAKKPADKVAPEGKCAGSKSTPATDSKTSDTKKTDGK